MIVLGHGVGEWVAQRTEGHYNAARSQAIGWEENGEIVCGVIYEGYTGAALVAHIACDKPMTRKFVRTIFDYPFNQAKVSKVIAPVAEYNETSRRLCERLGFVEEAKLEESHPSGAIFFYTMKKDQCKWIKE